MSNVDILSSYHSEYRYSGYSTRNATVLFIVQYVGINDQTHLRQATPLTSHQKSEPLNPPIFKSFQSPFDLTMLCDPFVSKTCS